MSSLKSRHLRICSSSEMQELDFRAEKEFLIDATLLMESAGRAAASALIEHYPLAGVETEILIFAGKGNNAGDAFVTARRLLCLDRRIRVFYLENENNYQGAVAKNFKILKQLKAKMTSLDSIGELESFFASSPGPFTIVDGILGTGLKGNLEGLFYDVVEAINALECDQVLSLDIPTGVSGDTGAVQGASIQATLTVSFGFPKLGHFLPPGATRRGQLVNVDISLPSQFRKEGSTFLLLRGPLEDLMKERDRYGHKNAFGHTLLIGGSPGRLGAIAMASTATHKMGTGLVTVATWKDGFDALLVKLPNETMSIRLSEDPKDIDYYRSELKHYSSVVVGPGWGLRPQGKTVLEELLVHYPGPVVLDADALNLVADLKLFPLLQKRKGKTVLTPHPGEMARLLGVSKDEVLKNPINSLQKAVQLTHSVVLLKGAATLISSPEEVVYLNHYPNDGMATAGSGDVLAGMIGGLLGQGVDALQGTLLGVYLHSLAGDFAAQSFGHRSMTAPDIVNNISYAFKEIRKKSDLSAPPVEVRAKLL